MNTYTYSKKLIALFLGIIITSFGASITIKVGIGIGAYDAVALSISYITNIKVGTIAIFANILCILGQLLLERKNFKPIQFLQVGLVLLQGTLINFLVYQMLANFEISNYIMKVICLAGGYFVIAFGISIIIQSDIIRNPLEGVCQVIADKINKPMGRLRQSWDIIFIILSVALTLIFKVDFTLREGTIVGMIIFGPALDFFRKPVAKQFKKWKIVF